MDEVKSRLVTCFQTVFPSLSEQEVLHASQSTVSDWDSVAAITLVNVLEDEFGFELDLEELGDLDSFDKVLAYVRTKEQVA